MGILQGKQQPELGWGGQGTSLPGTGWYGEIMESLSPFMEDVGIKLSQVGIPGAPAPLWLGVTPDEQEFLGPQAGTSVGGQQHAESSAHFIISHKQSGRFILLTKLPAPAQLAGAKPHP